MFAADPVNHVWHFWVAVALFLGAVLTVIAILTLYLIRVTKTRYPK
jgi:hypothetical protein